MQQYRTVFVDLRGHIQCDARKERGKFNVRHYRRCGGRNGVLAGNVSHEVLVVTDFDHRFLVVYRRNPRTGKHLHITLSRQQGNNPGKILIQK